MRETASDIFAKIVIEKKFLDEEKLARAREAQREAKKEKRSIALEAACFELGFLTLALTLLQSGTMFGYWGLNLWIPAYLSLPVTEGGVGLSAIGSRVGEGNGGVCIGVLQPDDLYLGFREPDRREALRLGLATSKIRI